MPPERANCKSEEGHCEDHENQTKTITAMKTERNVIAGVAVVFFALVCWIYNNNSQTISSDLKEIKAYISSARDSDTRLTGEIDNIKWRLSALEGSKK